MRNLVESPIQQKVTLSILHTITGRLYTRNKEWETLKELPLSNYHKVLLQTLHYAWMYDIYRFRSVSIKEYYHATFYHHLLEIFRELFSKPEMKQPQNSIVKHAMSKGSDIFFWVIRFI